MLHLQALSPDEHGNAIAMAVYSTHARVKQEAGQRAKDQLFALETHWCVGDIRSSKQVPTYVALAKDELEEIKDQFPKGTREQVEEVFMDKEFVVDKLTKYCVEELEKTFQAAAVGKLFETLMDRHVMLTYKWRTKE